MWFRTAVRDGPMTPCQDSLPVFNFFLRTILCEPFQVYSLNLYVSVGRGCKQLLYSHSICLFLNWLGVCPCFATSIYKYLQIFYKFTIIWKNIYNFHYLLYLYKYLQMFDKFTIIFYMKNIVTVRTIFYKFLLMFTNVRCNSSFSINVHKFVQKFTNFVDFNKCSQICTKVHKYL